MEIPKRLPTLENYLRVDEVGDRVLSPKIIKTEIKFRETDVTIEVEGEHYVVSSKLDMTKIDTKEKFISATMKVDFYHVNIGNELTDFGVPLKVVGSVVGTVKHLLNDKEWVDKMVASVAPNKNDQKAITFQIGALRIISKAEHEGDDRRNNLYNQFIRRIIPVLGGNVKKQTTEERLEKDPEQNQVRVIINDFILDPPIKVKEGISDEEE